MRGSIPNTGCGAQIIYANEKQVVMRGDVRYQLNGELQRGDASMTIRNARKSDSGKYGCRVHVPGWFNDRKIEVYLNVKKGKHTVQQHKCSISSRQLLCVLPYCVTFCL